MTSTQASEAPLEFTVEETGPCRKRVKVTIPVERVSKEFDKSYRQWSRSVPIPGFRPGKAPRRLVEKRYGEQVAQEVRQSLIEAAFAEALEKNELKPISDPELDLETVDVKPSEPVDFDFTVIVKPEFELPDYAGIEVSVPPAEPTDEEVDRWLRALRKRKATLRPVEDGTIASEDVATLAVSGSVGDTEVFERTEMPYEVGSMRLADLIVDLDETLLGQKVGATVEGKAFAPPHASNHALAGLEIELHAEVLDLKRPELPELDDELAKAFDFDSRDELVEAVRSDVSRRKEQEREKRIEDAALEKLVEASRFELPEDLIAREADEIARRRAYDLQMSGASEDEIAKEAAEARRRGSEDVAAELRRYFVLDKLVEKERILVPESEVRDAVGQIAQYHDTSPEQLYARLRDEGRLSSLRNQLRVKKARARLRKKVKVTDAPAETPPAKKKTTKASGKKKTKKKAGG